MSIRERTLVRDRMRISNTTKFFAISERPPRYFLSLEVFLIRTTLIAVSIMDENQGVENEHKAAYTST